MIRILHVVLAAALCVFAGSAPARTAHLESVVSPRDGIETIENPGCGFAGGSWGNALDTNKVVNVTLCSDRRNCTKLWTLQRFSKGYVYNNDYQNYTNNVMRYCGGADIPLTPAALESISNAFESCRLNGGTVIPRFAYTWDGHGGCEPDDFEMILTHIRQVSEIVSRYADVIPAVECGIIGAYGEMHTSRYCDKEYSARIIGEWLENTPESIKLLIRSCRYIVDYFGAKTKMELFANAGTYDQSKFMRIGFYNDGYLGTDGDYGTWGSGSTITFTREEGVGFLSPRADIPYGGEFATIDEGIYNTYCGTIYNPAKWNLVKEWYDTHLSYLRTIRSQNMFIYKLLENLVFSAETYGWDSMPDLSEYEGVDLRRFCEDHMGFRYIVRWAGIDSALADWRGGTGGIVLGIENTGFGKLLFGERYEVVLSKEGETLRIPCEIDVPLASLAPAAIEQRVFSFALPGELATGEWSLYIAARAPLAGETDVIPRRPIRFANEDGWSDGLAANYIGVLSVADSSGGAGGAEVETNAWFAVDLSDTAYPSGTGWTSPVATPAVNLGEFVSNADSLSTLDASTREVDLNQTQGVEYEPFAQCPSRAVVSVKGRILPAEAESLVPPSVKSVASLGFMDGNAWLWDGSVWRRLAGVGVPRFAADFEVGFDFASTSAPCARVDIAGQRSEWIPLASGSRLESVVFEGEGKVLGFSGTYFLSSGGVELVAPTFGCAEGENAVSIDEDGRVFTARISNAVAGAYYTAFTSPTLDGDFTAETCVQASGDGALSLRIDADVPSKFMIVVASKTPIASGTLLSSAKAD